MPRWLADFGRYCWEALKMLISGYDPATKSPHWVAVALGAAGVGSVSAIVHYLSDTAVSLSISPGLLISIVAFAVWFVVAVGWTAFRFKPTPALVFLDELRNDEDTGGWVWHYRVGLKNLAKRTVTGCTVEIESTEPPLPHLPLALHCTHTERLKPAPVTFHEGQTRAFDLCRRGEGSPVLDWCGAAFDLQSPVDGMVKVNLVAHADGMPPVRKTVRVWPKGGRLFLGDLTASPFN